MMEEKKIAKEGMLPAGCVLNNGKYKVDGYLASGGFGNTYLVTDTVFNEEVVIKELYVKGICGRESDSKDISISLTENREAFTALQQRFKREATILRKLIHPNIVRVLDLFDENGTSYYVMDLVDGESLSRHLKRTGRPMTEQEVMPILRQVLDALETVHAANIWHLDLKPANIMLDRKGNALLIDFGASKQLRSKDGHSLSISSALAYTPGFASPEQMEQSLERFGAWTDLYSLGATLYNLLTANQPPSPSEIVEDAQEALPMPPSVSEKMRDLIFWLMKPNRKERPQSVNDVKKFLDAQPVLPPKLQPTTPPPIVPPPPTPKAPVPETDDGETLLKEGKSSKATPPPAPTPQNINKGSKKLLTTLLTVLIGIGVGVGAVILLMSKCDDTLKEEPIVEEDLPRSNHLFTANGVSFMMIYVEGGTFTMGATSEQGSDAEDDERPAHSVTLSDYYIGETEVTQDLWLAVMGTNPSEFKGDLRLPVEQVTWEDCQTFIARLNDLTGQQFHLPTEAQWEFAARGGNKSLGFKYSGSNDVERVAWYKGGDYYVEGTARVKSRHPNELGIYDMSGNVYEWCQDWKGNYSSEPQTDPTGPLSGSGRMYRGGAWSRSASGCRVSNRGGGTQPTKNSNLGFRLAL